jgi:hypothetical protein
VAVQSLKHGFLIGVVLALSTACEEDISPTPVARDAGTDAGRKDAGRDAGKVRDAGKKDAGPGADADDAGAETDPDQALDPELGEDTPDADLVDTADAEVIGDSDAAVLDPTACTPFTMPDGVDCSPPDDGPLPRDLRCTGLYGQFEERKVACGVLEYKPAYQLWSDAAEKRRFMALPAGKKIDASNPDAFVFPVGTQFWKEFVVQAGEGKTKLAETRLLRKTEDGWLYTTYVWNAEGTEAKQMNNALGVPNYEGTGHTVPTRDQCNECHSGRAGTTSPPELILGFDALMLGPGAEGLTREKLAELDLLEPGAQLELEVPGNEVEKAALGYLHANCGISCHNENTDAKARESGLYLRLEAGELGSVAATDAFRSGINKAPSPNAKIGNLPLSPDKYLAIRPGDPETSLLVARQKLRTVDGMPAEGQMPRIGTNVVDPEGVDVTTRWIESMTEAGGYPAPE